MDNYRGFIKVAHTDGTFRAMDIMAEPSADVFMRNSGAAGVFRSVMNTRTHKYINLYAWEHGTR